MTPGQPVPVDSSATQDAANDLPDAGQSTDASQGDDGGDTGMSRDSDNGGDSSMSGDADSSTPPRQSGTLIAIRDGKIQGKVVGSTREFLGIPFAQPPVGGLRFAPPRPVQPWSGTRSTTEYGPICPQAEPLILALDLLSWTDTKIDEDCLTLNVYAPRTPPAEPLPVMTFIYGGGYQIGSGNQYDGQKLSESGPVVVVTINYRLGALGFLSLPELDAERPGAPSGNDAIRDQQLALRWVKDNISLFGGDPGNVTVFGESAGSISACIHLVSPGSKDLAQRLIMQSNVCVDNSPYIGTKARSTALSKLLAADMCNGEPDVLACLRAKPASDFVGWGGDVGRMGAPWTPTVEGAGGVLPDTPDDLIRSGNYNRAPFIVGSNKNEAGLFAAVGLVTPVSTIAELEQAADDLFPNDAAAAAAIKAQYRAASDDEASDVFVRQQTDLAWRCPARTLARMASAQGSKVFLYSFEEGTAWHSDDLTYVFGYAEGGVSQLLGADPPSPTLMEQMPRYWTHFARSGDPNGGGNPPWPLYTTASDQHLTLATPPAAGSQLSKSDCDFWDAHDDLAASIMKNALGGPTGM